jgi:hypothetical protein
MLGGRLVMAGDATDLAAELLGRSRDWIEVGAPAMGDYTVTFTRRPAGPPGIEPARAGGPWHIRRLRHDQTVTRDRPAGSSA